ncbi:winged helix-turn-helix transcriptional regulator [Bacillus sp. SB49]|uniref:ArsR/SmtB family transcription factor n=1 Tax=Bacillus sp. SB49 TaxID=1071080 RepID=UPI00041111C5|nr:metalloregulator ArsR/SmtB family transcription factor [Bacillus sp. SB49]QHT45488.1 winged helix-turn-helix transcriptional regulator [Bacillus sp. SB49]
MELFSAGTKLNRETYEVEVKSSLLWEAALGIAAITNDSLLDTLEWKEKDRELILASFSSDMIDHLSYVKEHNTWKTLLQLLHQGNFTQMSEFQSFIEGLSNEELKSYAVPYLGRKYEARKQELLEGSEEALHVLQKELKNHPFLPGYLAFIMHVSGTQLKEHLGKVMEGWFETVIRPDKEKLSSILTRDHISKQKRQKQMNAEQLVEWATDGVKYLPEPGVHKVILIPHYVYRPWNVEADLEGVKVFYYAAANGSIYPEADVPNKQLVQRYKALGDETRLRVLKRLMEEPHSLQSLTTELGMGKTTIHHHLKLLKSARLVKQEGNVYEGNPEVIESMGTDMKAYLGCK